LNSDRLTEA